MRYPHLRLLIFLLSSVALSAYAQLDTKNTSFVGKYTWPTSMSDVWGYADETGREYALVGTGIGPAIVDLIDPANPQELFWFQRPYSLWWDLMAYGQYAYVVNETGGGLMIIDMSGLPDSAIVKDTVYMGLTTFHNLWIDEKGYLYLVGGDPIEGMLILDLKNDPWNPTVVGNYNENYVHDVFVRNDTAYAAELFDGLTLVDLQDRSNPASFNNRNYTNSLTHNTWLSDDSKTCFSTDERFAGYIIAWDVSNPNNIVELDRYRSTRDGLTVPHNAHVIGDFIVISYYRDGVVILDVTHPSYMVEVGYYDTSPLEGDGFDGCWGAYPYLPSGLILSTDVFQGLDIIQASYLGAAFSHMTVLDANTQLPIANATVEVAGVDSVQTDAAGNTLFGTADSGVYNALVGLPGYASVQLSLDLINDSTRQDTVYLVPIPSTNATFNVVRADNGQPLPDVQVQTVVISGVDTLLYEGVTDAQGQWVVPQIVEGPHQILTGRWGFKPAQEAETIDNSNNTITLELEQGYRDDFVMDLGWQVSGNALFGHWVREVPAGTDLELGANFPAAPYVDNPSDIGEAAYITGNAVNAASAEDQDLDGGQSFLTSPPLDLTPYQEPRLRLDWWLVNSNNPEFSGLQAGSGALRIDLVVNNIPIRLLIEDTLRSDGWTTLVSIPLPPISGATIRIKATAGAEIDIFEAGIDFVQIVDVNTPVDVPDVSEDAPFAWIESAQEDEMTLGYTLPDSHGQGWQLDILDVQGRRIGAYPLSHTQERVTLPFAQPEGVYILMLTHNSVLHKTQRIRWNR